MADNFYRLVKFTLRSSYKKPTIYGEGNYDESTPGVFLSNHERFYGPIIVTTRFPIQVRQWAISMMIETKAAKTYIKETLFMDTFNMKEGISRILGNITAYPASWAIRSANPIPAYWDAKRSYMTIKNGLEVMKAGKNQLIFAPDCNPIDKSFKFLQGFLLLAKFSDKKLGINPKLYPVALNKKKATMAIGKPTIFNSNEPFKREANRVNSYIIEQIRMGYENPKELEC